MSGIRAGGAAILLALFAAIGGAAARAAEADVAALVRQADSAIRQGRNAEALTAAERALAMEPGSVAARFTRAAALAALGKPGDAEEQYRLLLAEFPELPEPRNNLAVLLAARGKLEEARAELETATRVAPSYAVAHENLGDVLARLALDAYRRAAASGGAGTALSAKLRAAESLASSVRPASPVPASPR